MGLPAGEAGLRPRNGNTIASALAPPNARPVSVEVGVESDRFQAQRSSMAAWPARTGVT